MRYEDSMKGVADQIPAPQATLMKMVVEGVMGGRMQKDTLSLRWQ